MFEQWHIDELIRLGWAPQYDDQLRIVGFDRWVREGDAVVVPGGCGRLVRYAAIKWDADLRFVKATKYGLLPNKVVRYA